MIKEKIYSVVSSTMGVPVSELNEETKILDLVQHSLDLIELIASLSSEFQTRIDAEEMKKIVTLGDLISYAENFENEKSVGPTDSF